MPKARKEEFRLRTMTDVKVFILFLLDHLRGDPVDETTLIRIIAENTDQIRTDYKEALTELTDAGHLYADTVDGETYYLISESGSTVAAELYSRLDPAFLERGLRYAHRFVSLARTGAEVFSSLDEDGGDFRLTLGARDDRGELFRLSLRFRTRIEAENTRKRFLASPDDVYRGILFATSGSMDFFHN